MRPVGIVLVWPVAAMATIPVTAYHIAPRPAGGRNVSSVVITLVYHIFVLYVSTRVIPTVRESGACALSQASLDDLDSVDQSLGLLSWYSLRILIMVYTSLFKPYVALKNGGNGGDWWIMPGGDVRGEKRDIFGGQCMCCYRLALIEVQLSRGHVARNRIIDALPNNQWSRGILGSSAQISGPGNLPPMPLVVVWALGRKSLAPRRSPELISQTSTILSSP